MPELFYGYWTDRAVGRRLGKEPASRDLVGGNVVLVEGGKAARVVPVGQVGQKIHDCAVAKVATAKCTPTDDNKFEVCDRYALSDDPTAQEEDAAIAAAEKECAVEMGPKQRSAHEQIAEYKRQHGIKE